MDTIFMNSENSRTSEYKHAESVDNPSIRKYICKQN